MGGKVKLPPELADLLRSDLERAIYEAALHRDDDLIARRCIIENQHKSMLRLSWAGIGQQYLATFRT